MGFGSSPQPTVRATCYLLTVQKVGWKASRHVALELKRQPGCGQSPRPCWPHSAGCTESKPILGHPQEGCALFRTGNPGASRMSAGLLPHPGSRQAAGPGGHSAVHSNSKGCPSLPFLGESKES